MQRYERYTRQPYGSLTGNSLRECINDLNAAFEDLMPLLLLYNDQIRWDDINHTDAPIGKFNLVANQNDYKILTDDNSLDILNITHVRILPSSTATEYVELKRLTADGPNITSILSPSSNVTGVPTHFVELGNRIYLNVLPSYSATNGVEIFFSREQLYFTVTGTPGDDATKPGIPKPFHELLVLKAAIRWATVNTTDDTNLLTMLRDEAKTKEDSLKNFIASRNPARRGLSMRKTNYI